MMFWWSVEHKLAEKICRRNQEIARQMSEEKKMIRRKEAIEKVDKAFEISGIARARSTIDGYLIMLEALGLLKFDEEEGFKPSSLRSVQVSTDIGCLTIQSCDRLVNEIYRQGFKIVKT